MNAKFFWVSLLAVVLSFFGGFYVANSINGRELARLQAENEQIKSGAAQKPAGATEEGLTDDEIAARVKEADDNPKNVKFSRDLGMALLRYGLMKQRADIVNTSTRLMQRAFDADPKDFQLAVALGNANYDMASLNGGDEGFVRAREFYAKALEIKPDDAETRADYGSTFGFVTNPDFAKASEEIGKALTSDPKNERALRLMAQMLVIEKKDEEAAKYLARLKEIVPKAPTLEELKAEVARDQQRNVK